jgi:hypothetical protein
MRPIKDEDRHGFILMSREEAERIIQETEKAYEASEKAKHRQKIRDNITLAVCIVLAIVSILSLFKR